MAVQVILNQVMGDVSTIGLEGDRWKRIVIVIAKGDKLNINNVDNDPNKLLLTVAPAEK